MRSPLVGSPSSRSSSRDLTRECLEPLAEVGEADIVRDLSARVPIHVISELLGLPDAHREAVRELSDRLLHREPDQRTMSEDNLAAGRELGILVWRVVDERRREPVQAEDLIGVLIDAELADEELVGFCLLLAVAGNETVTKLVANAAVAIHRYPDQRKLLLDDGALVGNAVEETLRWDAPSQFQGRTLTRDVELHGVTMPVGAFVLLLTGSANRDEREYDDPERFDVKRVIDRPLGFGHGPHVCLGAALGAVGDANRDRRAAAVVSRLRGRFAQRGAHALEQRARSLECAHQLHAPMNRLDLSERDDRLIHRALRQQADQAGDAVFMMVGDRHYSFAEVDTRANELAAGLRALGVGRGDTVAILMESCPEFVLLSFAVNRLGAVWVPANVDYKGDWLRGSLCDSRGACSSWTPPSSRSPRVGQRCAVRARGRARRNRSRRAGGTGRGGSRPGRPLR